MSRSATAPLSHWYHACEAAMDADREDDKAAIACAVTSSGPATLEPCLAHSDKACVCEISVVVVTVGSPAKTGVARIKSRRMVRFISIRVFVVFVFCILSLVLYTVAHWRKLQTYAEDASCMRVKPVGRGSTTRHSGLLDS